MDPPMWPNSEARIKVRSKIFSINWRSKSYPRDSRCAKVIVRDAVALAVIVTRHPKMLSLISHNLSLFELRYWEEGKRWKEQFSLCLTTISDSDSHLPFFASFHSIRLCCLYIMFILLFLFPHSCCISLYFTLLIFLKRSTTRKGRRQIWKQKIKPTIFFSIVDLSIRSCLSVCPFLCPRSVWWDF